MNDDSATSNNSALTSVSLRVLLAADETILSERLARFLDQNGFYTQHVRSGQRAREVLLKWKPDVVLWDLMLPDLNAIQVLTDLSRKDASGEQPPSTERLAKSASHFIVVSGHNNPKNVQECLRLGAADFWVKPLKNEEILSRLVLLLQAQRGVPEVPVEPPESLSKDQKPDPSALYYLHLTDLNLREALLRPPDRDSLTKLATTLDLSMLAKRVSFIACDVDRRCGRVIASSENNHLVPMDLDLNKYPEILYVLRHDRLLALDNLDSDPVMREIANKHKQIKFNSLIICPIKIEEKLWGVFSVRLPVEKQQLSDSEIRYAQLVAHIGGLLIRSVPEFWTTYAR